MPSAKRAKSTVTMELNRQFSNSAVIVNDQDKIHSPLTQFERKASAKKDTVKKTAQSKALPSHEKAVSSKEKTANKSLSAHSQAVAYAEPLERNASPSHVLEKKNASNHDKVEKSKENRDVKVAKRVEKSSISKQKIQEKPAPTPKLSKSNSKKSETSGHSVSTSTVSGKKSVHSSRKSPSAEKPKSSTKKKSSKKSSNHDLLQFPTIKWGSDSVVSFEATEHLPPPELTSIAGGFVFHGDSVVLANIPGRGWEIIGGRIDLGETPEETFHRECMKQIGASLSHIKMIGVVRIEHMGPEPPNCPYPFPIGYGIQYIGIVDQLQPFSGSDESMGRSLVSYEGFKEHYNEWNEYYEAVFDYACSVYKKWRKKLKIQ